MGKMAPVQGPDEKLADGPRSGTHIQYDLPGIYLTAMGLTCRQWQARTWQQRLDLVAIKHFHAPSYSSANEMTRQAVARTVRSIDNHCLSASLYSPPVEASSIQGFEPSIPAQPMYRPNIKSAGLVVYDIDLTSKNYLAGAAVGAIVGSLVTYMVTKKKSRK